MGQLSVTTTELRVRIRSIEKKPEVERFILVHKILWTVC